MDAQPLEARSGIIPFMKLRLPHALLLAVVCVPFSAAQNFSGSDDFSATSANWTAVPGDAGGQLSVNAGTLNFRDSGLATGVTSNAVYSWTANAGSYLADWQVQIDFTVNRTLLASETTLWELIVTNSRDTTDSFVAAFQRTYMQQVTAQPPAVQSYSYTDSAMVPPGYVSQNSIDPTTASLRISFTATNTTITAAFDGNGSTGGYSFTDFHSIDISTGATDWGMLASDYFTLRLQAWHSTNGDITPAIGDGVISADNFLATGATPVPEPATTALLVGLGALGLAIWRRRS